MVLDEGTLDCVVSLCWQTWFVRIAIVSVCQMWVERDRYLTWLILRALQYHASYLASILLVLAKYMQALQPGKPVILTAEGMIGICMGHSLNDFHLEHPDLLAIVYPQPMTMLTYLYG